MIRLNIWGFYIMKFPSITVFALTESYWHRPPAEMMTSSHSRAWTWPNALFLSHLRQTSACTHIFWECMLIDVSDRNCSYVLLSYWAHASQALWRMRFVNTSIQCLTLEPQHYKRLIIQNILFPALSRLFIKLANNQLKDNSPKMRERSSFPFYSCLE